MIHHVTIESVKFAHKGLRALFEHDDTRRLSAEHTPRIRRVLAELAVARRPDDLDRPGRRLHPLKGDRQGYWSVRVSGNWRIVFRFEGDEAVDVDLTDYH